MPSCSSGGPCHGGRSERIWRSYEYACEWLLFRVTDGGMVGEPSGAVPHETNKKWPVWAWDLISRIHEGDLLKLLLQKLKGFTNELD